MPWWSLVSASAAPVLLVGGWTLAAARQRPPVDATEVTVSALAGRGADDAWVMTAALAAVGVCHALTALGLRPAAPLGRAALALGGAATLAVAATPLPARGGSVPHAVAAAVAFVALSVWPVLARRQVPAPGVLLPRGAVAAAAVLLSLLAAFGAALVFDVEVGLVERVLAAAQAVWPLVVVAALRRPRRGCGPGGPAVGRRGGGSAPEPPP